MILGDIFAVLLSDQVTFHRQRRLKVGDWTTLIVLVPAQTDGKRRQVAELARRVDEIRPTLSSENAIIGHIRVDTYGDVGDLEKLIEELVREALAGRTK